MLTCPKVDLGLIAQIPAYAAGEQGRSTEIKQKYSPQPCKKKTAELITDFTI